MTFEIGPYGVHMSVTPRTQAAVVLAMALLWASRSLQTFSEPNFTDPQTIGDWWAVVSLSLALALLAPAVRFLVALQEATAVRRILVTLVGAAAVTVAVANLVKDWTGVESASFLYFFGLMVLLPGLLILGFVCLTRRPKWPALILVFTAAGMVNMELGGGVLILIAWAPVAFVLGRAGD